MTNSDWTHKTFNCLLGVGRTTWLSYCSCFVYISQILEIPFAFGPLSICLPFSLFYALINFRLAGAALQLLWAAAAAAVDFLFAYLPRFNQHTHTHTLSHTRSHKGLNHPTLSCLAFTRIQRAGPFLTPAPAPPSCCQSCPLIVCTISFVATWPAASPIYQSIGPHTPPDPLISPICLVAVLRLFMFICWYNLVTLFAYNLRLVVVLVVVCALWVLCGSFSSTWNMEIKFTAIKELLKSQPRTTARATK